jgi:cytochrome c556
MFVNMRKALFILVVTLQGLTACNHESTDDHPGQPVTQRRALFRKIGHALEQMALVLRYRRDYDPQEFSANALELNRLASLPWVHFPSGSDYAPSHAKSVIWSEPDAFKEMQQLFENSTARLLNASQSHDIVAIREAHELVVKSCRACHDKFHRN